MAIDRRLQIYDEQGNLVDYDILASDVKFLPDGKDLPTKLAEMQDDIDDAGSGDGTVTGVKVNGTTHEPNGQGVVDIGTVITQHQDISQLATKTELAGKVDKNGTDSLMTAAEHTKLGNLPTATELSSQMNAKANDNAVVKTISVNGGTPATPVNGNVNIIVEGAAGEDGITPHIGSNGNWWIGDTDTNVKAQGPMGSVTITDGDIDTLEVHNALNAYTGLLGMSGAMKLKNNIDAVQANLVKLYNKLANMAFWDATDQAASQPTALDWSLPKHSVAITNNLANSSITRNGESVGNSFQAEEGSTVTLIVAPSGSSYALTNVTYSKDSGSPTSATSLGDGTYKIEFFMGGSDVTISVSGTVVESVAVSLSNADGKLELSPLTCVKNGTYSGTLAVKSGETDYGLPSTISATIGGVAVVFDGTTNSYDPTDGSIIIANVSGALVITAAAAVGWSVAPKSDYSEGGSVVTYGMQQGRSINANDGYVTAGVADNAPAIILSPAAYPYSEKICSSSTPPGLTDANTNPGKDGKSYFPTGGKRYLRVMMEFNSSETTTGNAYKVAVGCYNASTNSNVDSSSNYPHIGNFVSRIQYITGNVTTFEWVFDLHTEATSHSLSAGAITYIKLLMGKYVGGSSTATDSRTWIDNMTLKYKFTDD